MENIGSNEIHTNLLDLSIDTIYSSKVDVFARVPKQSLVPTANALRFGTVRLCYVLDYDTDSGVEGEAQLFNYTDFVAVDGTIETLPEVGDWTTIVSKEYEITPGKAYSVLIRRKTGSGNNFVYVEAGAFILL